MNRYITPIISIILAAALSSCGSTDAIPADVEFSVITPPPTETVSETTAETTAETTVTTIPEPVIRRVTFTATGDNLIHSSIYKQAARRAAADESYEGSYDFSYAYANVADLLDKADITVVNQETLICGDEYEPSNYPQFNSPTDLGFHMRDLGVDVFTIANNHMLDKYEQGLLDCLDYYDENNMLCVGAYRDAEDRSRIRTMEVNDVTVAFLAYTESTNGLMLPAGSSVELGSIATREDIERAGEEIRAAEEIADITIVSLHWGVENSDQISDYQRETAKFFAEAGADVILGNHPHVLRDIERITREDGSTVLCAYSLGNFISAQSVGTNLIGGILDFTAEVDEGGNAEICDIAFTPIVTHYDSGYSDVRLYKFSDYTPELANAHGVRSKSKFSYEYIEEYLNKHGLLEFAG